MGQTEISWRTSIWNGRRKGKDNIKMDSMEIGCDDLRWMELAQDHVHWWASVLSMLNLLALLLEC
jgi:hypothetical protein